MRTIVLLKMEEEDSDGERSDIRCVDFDWRNLDSAPRLSRAVRLGDINALKKLIEDGAYVNAADNRGWTPLHEASVDDKNYKIVEELINSGAFLEHQTVEGETALYLAARNGCAKIVELLIREGASVNCHTLKKFTPLHIAACSKDCEEVLHLLIAAGAKTDALDIEDRSALHFAVEENNITATRVLLEAGLDPMIVDFFGRNVVVSACMTGNIEILELLLGKLGHKLDVINYQSGDGWTLLMEAVQFKHIDIVKLLIRYGADTSLQEGRGLLALHLAAHSGRTDILKLILDNTPTDAIEATSVFSSRRNAVHTRSLLALAIDKNSYESVELLLSRNDLSSDVISCPVKMGNVLVSAASFLLMFADAVPHGKDKLKMLKLLLTKPELVEPKYNKAVGVIDPTEAAISVHERNHPQHGCICYQYLSLILEKGGSADNERLFQAALKSGFTSGVSLLLTHSNVHEPEQLLKTMWADIHTNNHSWNGTESNTFAYLMDLSTDRSITFESIRQEAEAPVHQSLESIIRLVTTKRKPATLKRLARSTFRSYLHAQTASKPSDFLKTIKQIDAPKSVVAFLMYNDI
ncbi:hypothetical protein O3M35_003218 [Rhynocoris fuscipes]|uniref:Uncharacterized protein n=1 Tax=Rhynocoris fuscipes TaxID=488301 RepID=A0AAW1CM90_9HEMI